MTCLQSALLQAIQVLTLLPQASPRLEAELLLCAVLDRPRSYLATWPEQSLSPAQTAAYANLLHRRQQGEPIAYILGYRDFWTLTLQTTPDALIPRPETELLIELALQIGATDTALEIVDLGTGSGAVALALAQERPNWIVHATDQSATALALANSNARQLQQSLHIHLGNWYAALPSLLRFDLILSNPPYIPENDPHLNQGDLLWEPRQALASGPDGLEALRILCAGSQKHLKPGGSILLEHGYNQGYAVRNLLQQAGLTTIQTWRDLAGHERVTGGINYGDSLINKFSKLLT